ncbi:MULTISPECIES: acyl-CoA dehydrogenase family protein [unclassified Sphingomonas]|jgi:alkylation response protein AidB-like acyl-CoA dehydrogenase|uniref:acyl-CoA dehydrogenase family protein n=1 Tax=unclassified Sphingomonas TaxID=196159 RepID=UPI000829E64A|nr:MULTISPECIES: acyl-CoA dehydrogenase family protein [unclassified Sphingomonas]
MRDYTPPVDEYRFLFGHVLAREFRGLAAHERVDDATLAAILDGIGTFARDHVLPLADRADAQGARIENGVARAPDGYRDAYQAYVRDGWATLGVGERHGGQGLPLTLSMCADEFLSSGSIAFALYASLRVGVYEVLAAEGDPSPGAAFLHHLASGEWTGTMCLTEPQCGTDLALIRTIARPDPAGDGTYRLDGTKIFITGGDHDLTDNIVHLVLARVADGPPGLAGLGLFVTAKYLADADGQWRTPNGVECARLEAKMGIHASATAELRFENSRAWMIGEPGKGLAGMFAMMKLARIGTPFQAIGVAELATQNAHAYAMERIQGRDAVDTAERASIPIYRHPNVKRELARMRVWTTSVRMLATFTALINDQSVSGAPEVRARATALLPLLMPVSKAAVTETGVDVVTAAMQSYGGHGYIRENGVERLLRDVQILPIYEGTNDIQALDLVLRRLPAAGGAVMAALLDWLDAEATALSAQVGNRSVGDQTIALLATLRGITAELGDLLVHDRFAALQSARDYLWLVAHGVMSVLWLRALAALEKRLEIAVDADAKRAEATFYFSYLAPDAQLRAARLRNHASLKDALNALIPNGREPAE